MYRRNFLQSSLAMVSGGLLGETLANGILLSPSRLLAGVSPAPSDVGYESLKAAFTQPGSDSHNWTRWWWFGPNATEQGISYELEQMHKQGLGGVEMQWMTPLELEGNFDFLSDRWAQLVKFTVQKAKELGLRVDFTFGTGWPYGGPWIPIELAFAVHQDDDGRRDQRLRRENSGRIGRA